VIPKLVGKKSNFPGLLVIIVVAFLASYYVIIFWYTIIFGNPIIIDKYALFSFGFAQRPIYNFFLYPLELISLLILFLGSNKLQDFKRTNVVKWNAFSMMVYWVLYLLIVLYLNYLFITYTIYYSIWLIILLILLKTIPIPISFIIFGISNRKKYGNYLVSSGMIRILEYIGFLVFFFLFWSIFSEFDLDIVLTLVVVNGFIMSVLYSSFLFFFGMKLRNWYMVTFAILIFIIDVGSIYINYVFYGEIFNPLYNTTVIYLAFLLIGVVVATRFFELGKRFKRGVRVFISHSVDEFKVYRIEDIAKFLESQKNVSRVYYCELDLSGNIDKWMQRIVPRCHTLIFISTKDSINSKDCSTELELAKTNKLQIVPVLGVGIEWDDLESLDLHREYGAKFEPMKFEEFCNTMYERVLKYKEALETELPKKVRKN